MTDRQHQHRESRVRYLLGRSGYRLMKSRSSGGYQIVDHRNFLVAGWTDDNRGFGFNLDDVEGWAYGD
jgi:hypothetical protein